MIRFIFNFIFFGVLFYAIWLFFPDAFNTLASWAAKVYEVIVDLATAVIDYVSELTKPSQQAVTQDGEPATIGFIQVL